MTSPSPPKRPPDRGPAPWFNYASASSVGIEIVVVFLMFTLGAYWLERNVTYWSPWTAMIGMGFGMFASSMVIVRLIREHDAAMAAKAESEANPDAASNAASPDPRAAGPTPSSDLDDAPETAVLRPAATSREQAVRNATSRTAPTGKPAHDDGLEAAQPPSTTPPVSNPQPDDGSSGARSESAPTHSGGERRS